MGYVIAGVSTVGFLAIVGHAARNDDHSQSQARNVMHQVLIVFAIAAVLGAIIWVATYGS